MTTVQQDDLRLRPITVQEPDLVLRVVADLLASGLPTAPHVVAKLLRRLNGDAMTAREVTAELTPSQRSGQRMLPRPLPLTPSTSATFDALDLDDDELYVLLVASLCTDDRLELLLDASLRDAESLMAGRIGEHLSVSRGHCRLVDARMAIWLRHTASDFDTVRAHERLWQVHRDRGETARAHWHRARCAWGRLPDIAPLLIAAAREMNESGHPEWAFTIAVEAADHADAAEREEAQLVAGASAVGAGCFEDASQWLGNLFPRGALEHRTAALASMLIAETCAHGVVPVLEPAEHRPPTTDPKHWHAWARTAGIAAVMCAERGDASAMRLWLAELREADIRAGAGGELRDPAVSLCWTLTGDADAADPRSQGPFSGAMASALCAAVDGDIERGLQLLARAQTGMTDEPDALIAGFEHSPLIGAYLAVAQTLLHFWRGDIDAARARLSSASVELPVGVPFAGLGAVLARRLDVAVLGAPGPLPQALAETLPAGIRVDRLVDSGLCAYLGGAHEQAATDISLWQERGGPEPALSVPGLDEVGPVVDRPRVEPSELTDTRDLLYRIRQLSEVSWRREHDEIADASRNLSSSFGRARVAAMLGSTCIMHGDLSTGRRHLRAARTLFEDSGALAWRDATEDRLTRLSAQMAAKSADITEPIAVLGDPDPLSASRVAWDALLTGREIEVAMRVADGSENREIATDLDVSVRTVEVHIRRLFDKLGVRNRVELAVLAHRVGRVF